MRDNRRYQKERDYEAEWSVCDDGDDEVEEPFPARSYEAIPLSFLVLFIPWLSTPQSLQLLI